MFDYQACIESVAIASVWRLGGFRTCRLPTLCIAIGFLLELLLAGEDSLKVKPTNLLKIYLYIIYVYIYIYILEAPPCATDPLIMYLIATIGDMSVCIFFFCNFVFVFSCAGFAGEHVPFLFRIDASECDVQYVGCVVYIHIYWEMHMIVCNQVLLMWLLTILGTYLCKHHCYYSTVPVLTIAFGLICILSSCSDSSNHVDMRCVVCIVHTYICIYVYI